MSDVVLMQFRCKSCNKVFFSYVVAYIGKRYIEDKALEITYTILQVNTQYGNHEIDKTVDNTNPMIFNKPIENERICRKCREIQKNDSLLFPNGVL